MTTTIDDQVHVETSTEDGEFRFTVKDSEGGELRYRMTGYMTLARIAKFLRDSASCLEYADSMDKET